MLTANLNQETWSFARPYAEIVISSYSWLYYFSGLKNVDYYLVHYIYIYSVYILATIHAIRFWAAHLCIVKLKALNYVDVDA